MTAFLRAATLLTSLVLGGYTAAFAQAPPLTVGTPGGDVTVLADRIEREGENLVVATGNVDVTRGTARLLADRIELDRATGDIVASGRVIFYDGEDRLQAERIDYNYKTGTGVVYDGEASTAPYYRIRGERMERLGESVYRVRRGIFTTCEDDPPTWSIHTDTAQADLNEFVYGTNISFWVKNVPVIPFFPFFAAAIRRERQTGFLFPRFGHSSRKGYFAEIPFFWAISDSQDATITLNAYTERGVGVAGEYRYILSATNYGSATGFFLRETELADDNRAWWGVRHDWLITPELALKADINGVSDDTVFRDYGDRLHDRSLQRVESNLFLTRRWPTWNLLGNLFWYQDLTQRRPVELKRLPEIRLDGMPQPLPGLPGVLYELESSAVNFVRDVGSQGVRVDVHPRLSRPLSAAGLFTVTPFLGGRLTAYDKTVTGTRVTRDGGLTVETTSDEAQVRRLLEVGSAFESRASRVYNLGGRGGIDAALHTIEPRATYTLVAGQGGDARVPLDPRRQIPSWSEIDQIPDTSNFVTYSVTNRIQAKTSAPAGTEPVRWEFVRFVVGHSYDFRNDDRPLGNVTGDLIVNPNRIFSFRGDTSFDVYGDGFQSGTTDLSVAVPPVTASIGTRFNKPTNVNFLQSSLRADLTRFVTGRFITNWDIRSDTFVENRVALDLKFQCWAFTLEFVKRHDGDDEVRFSLNLLGLGAPLSSGVGLGQMGGAAAASTTAVR